MMLSPVSDLIVSAAMFDLRGADAGGRLAGAVARLRPGLSPRVDEALGLAAAALADPADAEVRARLVAAVRGLEGVRCAPDAAWWAQ